MSTKVPLSIVIITRNEEDNIKDCLESVKWADDIVIVDDNSTDRTVDVAQNYTERIFRRKMDIEGRHRNWAYAQARHNWILSLDADERITPQLKEEIIEILSNQTEFKGFAIPRRNYIGSYWVKYGGWYPSAQLKLFRKEDFHWEEVGVHPRAFLNGRWNVLKSDIIHYSYCDFTDFVNKLNRQTTWEAEKWFNDKRKMNLRNALRRSIDRFFRSYIGKEGHRDGLIGYVLAFFAGFYQFLSYAKYWELKYINKNNQCFL